MNNPKKISKNKKDMSETLKIVLLILLILLNIADSVYIIFQTRDKIYSADLLASGLFIGAFVVMLVELL